jgi:hypothetical protein
MAEAVTAVYNLDEDRLTAADIPRFDRLRTRYRVRREFKNTAVRLRQPRPEIDWVRLGFAPLSGS